MEQGDYLLSGTDGAKPFSGHSKAKAAIDKIVGFSDWTFDDIRRTVATELVRRKVPQERSDRILGHAIGGV